MKPKKRINRNAAEPIRDPRKIAAIKNLLRDQPRDYCLFTLGINTALRGTDLLSLKIEDVLDDRGEVRETIQLRAGKTGKQQVIKLNQTAREALNYYLSSSDEWTNHKLAFGSHLFRGRSQNDKPLHPAHLTKLVKKWAQMVGLTEGSYGISTLRKTWGYQARKRGIPIELIQAKLGHASPSVTRRYIGITQDEISDVEARVEL